MPTLFSIRRLSAVALLSSLGLLLYALHLQTVLGVEPCPLCLLQRLFVLLLALSFAALILKPQGIVGRLSAGSVLVLSLLGGLVSVRHLWLQTHPELAGACVAGLDTLLNVLPFDEIIAHVYRGGGACADTVWQWLGLSIPAWLLLCFCGYAILGGYCYVGTKRG